MTEILPEAIAAEILRARREAERKASRLRVAVDGKRYTVLRRWDGGFAVEAGVVPPLRGMVELLEGTRLIATCLIIASEEEDGEMRYEFKRSTPVRDAAPLDFQKDDDAPSALIGPA
ncbi:hypothetical protein KM176_12710 [Pseudooceanicola sp. CBS1P-1]|uniref:Uncharacterized protein n=1 Tax=Pseudooceanicola albus TaxID=2692189 RepID=A0A6L7G6Y3_9RHOB|nr:MULTISPECIES: hypothetical protein [Pseudooceanicola]MBT9384722.1 hypothetical protein [Pseudooceanicola endophyticus]MXN18423.1 hypothetical protein [Pseudooceanicola albus]